MRPTSTFSTASRQLYADLELKRVYYAPFRPVRHTPLEEHPATPMQRSNRLYQIDWLKRIYRYSDDEVKLALDQGGFLPLELDPKQTIALENLDAFPVDINNANRDQLMRTPGLGPISVQRILQNRHAKPRVNTWQQLTHHGSSQKTRLAVHHIPWTQTRTGTKQLRLDTIFNQERKTRTDGGTEHLTKNRAEANPPNRSLHPRRPNRIPNQRLNIIRRWRTLRHTEHLHAKRHAASNHHATAAHSTTHPATPAQQKPPSATLPHQHSHEPPQPHKQS